MFDHLDDPNPPEAGPDARAAVAARLASRHRRRQARWVTSIAVVVIVGLAIGLPVGLRSGNDGAVHTEGLSPTEVAAPAMPGGALFHPTGVSSDGQHVWVISGGATSGPPPQPGHFPTPGSPSPPNVPNAVTEIDAHTGAVVQVISGPSYEFNNSAYVSSDGRHVWVGNTSGSGQDAASGSVTELDARTGALIQVIQDPSGAFNGLDGVSSDGIHVWVSSTTSGAIGSQIGSVTVLGARTGALVRVISGPSIGVDVPGGVSSDGKHVWVPGMSSDGARGSFAELDASTGALVRNLSDPRYTSSAFSSDRQHVWFVSDGAHTRGNLITELDARTGAMVRSISGSSYGLNGPGPMVSEGRHVWIFNVGGNSVTELDASTGALVRNLSDPSFGSHGIEDVSSDGIHLWVTNDIRNSVTELDARTGAVVEVIQGPASTAATAAPTTPPQPTSTTAPPQPTPTTTPPQPTPTTIPPRPIIMCGAGFFDQATTDRIYKHFGTMECFGTPDHKEWIVLGMGDIRPAGTARPAGGAMLAVLWCGDSKCFDPNTRHDFSSFSVYYPPSPFPPSQAGVGARYLGMRDGRLVIVSTSCGNVAFDLELELWYPEAAAEHAIETGRPRMGINTGNSPTLPWLSTPKGTLGAAALSSPRPPPNPAGCAGATS